MICQCLRVRAAHAVMNSALWFHRATEHIYGTAGFASNSWVEVTHCGYDQETVVRDTPMWFLAASGSGVHLNIGRTWVGPVLHVREEHKNCWDRELNICPNAPNGDAYKAHVRSPQPAHSTAARALYTRTLFAHAAAVQGPTRAHAPLFRAYRRGVALHSLRRTAAQPFRRPCLTSSRAFGRSRALPSILSHVAVVPRAGPRPLPSRRAAARHPPVRLRLDPMAAVQCALMYGSRGGSNRSTAAVVSTHLDGC